MGNPGCQAVLSCLSSLLLCLLFPRVVPSASCLLPRGRYCLFAGGWKGGRPQRFPGAWRGLQRASVTAREVTGVQEFRWQSGAQVARSVQAVLLPACDSDDVAQTNKSNAMEEEKRSDIRQGRREIHMYVSGTARVRKIRHVVYLHSVTSGGGVVGRDWGPAAQIVLSHKGRLVFFFWTAAAHHAEDSTPFRHSIGQSVIVNLSNCEEACFVFSGPLRHSATLEQSSKCSKPVAAKYPISFIDVTLIPCQVRLQRVC